MNTKKLFYILITFFITGCEYILMPITLPLSVITYPITKGLQYSIKPYNNSNYIVTDECAKDIIRAIAKDAGKGVSSEKEFIEFKSLFNTQIQQHIDPSWNIEKIIELNGFYFGTGEGVYSYIISNSSNKLKLVLLTMKVKNPSKTFMKGAVINNSNIISGLESYVLDKCEIS